MTRVFLAYTTTFPGRVQATLMTLDGTQTLVASWLSKLDSRGASEGDLALLGSNSGRWDLVKDQSVEVLLERRVVTGS